MRVVVRSSSLVFSILGIILNVPLVRVKKKTDAAPPVEPAANGAPSEDEDRRSDLS
jgi:hypothetical protein